MWDSWTCSLAVEGGHLDCLKYMRENGFPWDSKKYALISFESRSWSCFAYALCYGCDVKTLDLFQDAKSWNGGGRELEVAIIIYVGGKSCLPKGIEPVVTRAEAIIAKVHLLRRMKDAYKHAAASRIQRTWKAC